jgi:hypothetical protein
LLHRAAPFSAQPLRRLDTFRPLGAFCCTPASRTKLPLLGRATALCSQLLLLLSAPRLSCAIRGGPADRTQIRSSLLALHLLSLHLLALLDCIAPLASLLWLQCLACGRGRCSTLRLLRLPRLLSPLLGLTWCLAGAWLLYSRHSLCGSAWRISSKATMFTSGQRVRLRRVTARLDQVLRLPN